MFGFICDASPLPKSFLKEGDLVKFGSTSFVTLFTPGHSPGSISFYNESEKFIVSGDVLFYGSIGRYDLPGSDGNILFDTLVNKMMQLPDDVMVYSGHGPETKIGFERLNNPFIKQGFLA
jgi:glyoxylase-like metal-dependent hydrolase (beta-lactamase superfamily II)